MVHFIQYLLLICVLVAAILPSSIATSASIELFLVIGLFLTSLANKRLTLLSAFTAAFAYMIPPEAILGEGEIIAKWGEENVLVGYRVLMLSFVSLYVGFLVFRKRRERLGRKFACVCPLNRSRAKALFIILTIFCVTLFSPMIVYGLTTGRGSSSLYNPEDGGGLLFNIGVLGYFLFALLYVICGFWAYYFSSKSYDKFAFLKAILYSSPILLIGLASGTRYVLCFMLACLLFPWIYILDPKKIKWFVCGGIALMALFFAMKYSRYGGFDLSVLAEPEISQTTSTSSVVEKMAEKGSPEGLIRNMAMINLYTQSHSYTYGKSFGAVVYFWIPRFIWEDKPTLIDHWLIREYESVGPGFSTASSFCGELFMDFGYFCVVLCFFFGGIMARLDAYVERVFCTHEFFPTVVSGLVLGWAFFMTRSTVTATIPLVLGSAVAFVLYKILLIPNATPNNRSFR